MANIKRLLTKNKDCRIVLVDTKEIIERELADFPEGKIRELLEEFITLSVLLSSLKDTDTKSSYVLRLAGGNKLFAEIRYGSFSLSIKESIKSLTDENLFNEKSGLTVSVGDWNTGLYTGSVAAVTDDLSLNFSHYTYQSEQTPTEFLVSKKKPYKGILIQPLPFFDYDSMQKISDFVRYNSELFYNTSWNEAENVFEEIANITLEETIA